MNPTGPPRQILVIRHGEKPADGANGVDVSGEPNPHSLTPLGWQRAGALAVLFAPVVGPQRPGVATPEHLVCPSYRDRAATESHRTYQTLTALSGRLDVPIEYTCAAEDTAALVHWLLARGGTALVCWDHNHIPDIARHLPSATGDGAPPEWPGERFDVIWSFTLVAGAPAPRYAFAQMSQLLLPGDRDSAVTA